MHKSFAWTLAACVPFAMACVDDVALAAKTDGGARDVPTTDAPAVDAPVVDAPVVDAPVVDAPTTDAPVVDTPTVDAPVVDVPPVDAPPPPYCPEDLDQNTAQNPDLLYPRALVRTPPDTGATFPVGAEFVVRGRWLAPRRLATPLPVTCVASVAADAACHPDAVIRVQPDGDAGGPVEFVTSVALGSLPSLPEGTAVVLRLDPTIVFFSGLSPTNVVLTLRRASDDALLMVVANTSRAPEMGSVPWTYGPVRLQRAANADCVSRPEPMCRRILGAYALDVSGVTAGRALAPRESATFDSPDGRFAVRNLLALHRIPNTGLECADLLLDLFSFEIVRQP